MKILILGSFGKGALENSYVRGFTDIDEAPAVFDITKDYYDALSANLLNRVYNKINPAFFYKNINKKLREFITTKSYDVVLVFKGLTLVPGTIRFLKEHAKLVVCYNPDHPYQFYSEGSGNANIIKSIPLYDLYFTYAESICNGLKEKFSSNAFVIPFGFDDHQPVSDKGTDEFRNSWVLLGSYDQERAAFVLELNEAQVKVYGEQKWQTRNKGNLLATKYYQGRALYEDAYRAAIAGASGVLNLLRKQNLVEQSHNMRTFEVPGYGGLLIAQRTNEQQKFFSEDTEAIYFDSVAELKQKIRMLEANPEKIEQIKAAGHQRAISSGYTYRDRCSQLMNILKQYLNQ